MSAVIVVGVEDRMPPVVLIEAARLARDLGAELVCGHVDRGQYAVSEDPDGTVHSRPFDPDLPEQPDAVFPGELIAHIGTVLQDAALGAVPWSGRELAGDPAHALAHLANVLDARFIVVGTHEPGARGGLREFFQGSIATHLAHRQHRPVLVVPLGGARPAPGAGA
ncbi:MAG TPA: universal stress protein [Microbacterium sp.]|nr:universal stress protein [Microbacterium sp.]